MDQPAHNPTRRRAAIAMVAAIVVMSSTSAVYADDWQAPGLDATQSRLSAERSGARFFDGRWTASFPAGARVLASPVVADGFAVTVSLDGAVRSLREDDGQTAWQADLGSAVHGTPALSRGRLFVPTFGNKVVALHLESGKALWTRDLGGTVLSSPTPVEGDIVVAAGFPQRYVVRLSGSTGRVVWQSPAVMEQFSNTPPAIGAGVVVVGGNGGHYYAFDVLSGAPRWDYVADGSVHLTAPIILGQRVYMAGGNDSDHVHAVDVATGTPAPGWPITLPAADPDITGTRVGRHRAVSSFSAADGLLVLQTRLDDALDTNADDLPDKYLSRETVVGLDPANGTMVWQHALARAERGDQNDVPKFFICPTPAAFATAGGPPLVAVASSLDPSLVVLDVASGAERARHAVAGPALASPVVANGRLYAAAMNGALEALLSSVNHPPAAPIAAANPRPLDAAAVTLHWLPAFDPDGELASYQLRLDSDGEVLESWQQEIMVPAGVTSLGIAASLTPGVTYGFAVRARDPNGAYSPWSAVETFQVTTNPPVTIAGTPAPSLKDALRAARPGDVVTLAAGTYALAETLHVGAGVSLQGTGAASTTLDARGLGTGISFEGGTADRAAGLDGVTVAGADTCVQVAAGSTGVRLSHLVARDCRIDGVMVALTAAADIVNATLVGDGTAVHAAGAGRIKNSLLTANGVALACEASGSLVSTYDDLFANQVDYSGTSAGTGDFSSAVTFADLPGHDLRLLQTQPSTDKGDPADPPGLEPAPAGGRINLGAFGGTAQAEPSAATTALGRTDSIPRPTASPLSGEERGSATASDAEGCGIAGSPVARWAAPVVLALLLSRRRRGNKSKVTGAAPPRGE